MRFNEGNAIVIDELKICYLANQEQVKCLMDIEVGSAVQLNGYTFYRLLNDRFRFFFDVVADHQLVAQMKFGHFTDAEDSPLYVYLKVMNPVLYDIGRLKPLLAMPNSFGMVFNNFTSIDLALDGGLNYPSVIKRLMRDKTITTIINGKAVKDRKKVLQGVNFEYSTTLDRLNHPTVTFKQKKAISNKSNGITVQAYDKKAEIDHSSDKHYILNYYGHPTRLYRLEVRLHYQELKDFFKMCDVCPSPDDLFDSRCLELLFYYHLSAVIRFTRGRNKIAWKTIIDNNGKV